MHIVQPHRELNQAVAVTSDEVLEVVEERVPHTNLSPEAIVNDVEAVQVAKPDGASSIVSCPIRAALKRVSHKKMPTCVLGYEFL